MIREGGAIEAVRGNFEVESGTELNLPDGTTRIQYENRYFTCFCFFRVNTGRLFNYEEHLSLLSIILQLNIFEMNFVSQMEVSLLRSLPSD